MYSNNKNILKIISILFLLMLVARYSYSQMFTRIDTSIVCTVEGFSHTACWGDYNNDGYEDLVIINGGFEEGSFSQFLFINEGDWRFKQVIDGPVATVTSSYGSLGATWGDYDNDGQLDLFIAGFRNRNNMLFKNNGDESFTHITDGVIVNDGGDSGLSNWIDIENDGYLDLYVTNRREQKNFLYRNNGNGTFTKITTGELANRLISPDLGGSWADYDDDGDLDLFELGLGDGKRYLFVNDGYGNFTLETQSSLTDPEETSWSWFPPSWGDYDNDCYPDVFFTAYGVENWASMKDFIFHNQGDGTFERKTDLAPVTYDSEHDGGYWADLDNDGYLDLIISTYYTNVTKIYWNNGDGTFTEAGSDVFSADYGGCISIADIDKDGFLDMFVGRGFYGSFKNAIYANNGNPNSWINIKLVGTVSNKSAIGSKVRAKATIGGTPVWQIRETGLTHHSKNIHFGFGDAGIIDSLIVQWSSGHDTVLTNIDVNQFMTITELIPSGYLRASFAADTNAGKGDVSINFTDISRSDPGNPIIAWSWDFDNDGTEDSNEQNPSHTYSWSDGNMYTMYDVSLKVSNGTDTSTIIKKEFINLFKPNPDPEDDLTDWAIATTASSSVDEFLCPANYATDNNSETRWESQPKNDEWLKIELDTIYNVGKVIIHWAAAYAEEYKILTSLDNEAWDTVFCKYTYDGEKDTVYFTGHEARYILILGLTRNSTFFGCWIYEVEIYQSDGNEYYDGCGPTGTEDIDNKMTKSVSVYPNPVNEAVTFSFNLQQSVYIHLAIYDIAGKRIAEVYNGYKNAGPQAITWKSENLTPGMYFYKIMMYSNIKAQIINGKLLVIE